MFSGLLIILVPLIVGYLIPLRQQAALKVINQLLSWMVYLILFLWVSVWRFSITSPVTCGDSALFCRQYYRYFTV